MFGTYVYPLASDFQFPEWMLEQARQEQYHLTWDERVIKVWNDERGLPEYFSFEFLFDKPKEGQHA